MMPPNDEAAPGNPILSTAMRLIDAVVPRGMSEPEKALREIIPTLRYLRIAPVQAPTKQQMEAVRAFREFEMSSLLQVRKALQAGTVRLGPFPGDLAAETFVPVLVAEGLSVSMEEMSPEEKKEQFGFLDDPAV